VRAVNLIPADQRRGAGGLAGRSGGIVYVVAAGLLVVVVLGVVYAFAVKGVADRQGQLNQITAEVALTQDQANALQDYIQVHQLAQSKVSSVVSIAESRFNWPGAMSQLALALPGDVTLTGFTAVAGNGSSAATGGVPSTTASAGSPTVSMTGCAASQAEVATIITRLQSVPAVTNVSLGDAAKQTDGVPNSGTGSRAKTGGSGGKCPKVTWSLSLAYSPSYTVPTQKLPRSVTAPATVSHGASSGATAQSSQVSR
jgi:Tfp pilus assembly protein PilN